jgi:hypothetical protein
MSFNPARSANSCLTTQPSAPVSIRNRQFTGRRERLTGLRKSLLVLVGNSQIRLDDGSMICQVRSAELEFKDWDFRFDLAERFFLPGPVLPDLTGTHLGSRSSKMLPEQRDINRITGDDLFDKKRVKAKPFGAPRRTPGTTTNRNRRPAPP